MMQKRVLVIASNLIPGKVVEELGFPSIEVQNILIFRLIASINL